jgi:uncharacterized RDD family membrane protein YckC
MTPDPGGYAGIVSRGVAFTVDAVVALFVCTVGLEVVTIALASVGFDSQWRDDASAALGYVLALPVVFAIYCAGFWTLLGRTPGMMLLGLRVVTVDGARPRAGRSIVRALGYWLSSILLLGFAWIAVDPRRQGFHDKLAGTLVIYDWGRRATGGVAGRSESSTAGDDQAAGRIHAR